MANNKLWIQFLYREISFLGEEVRRKNGGFTINDCNKFTFILDKQYVVCIGTTIEEPMFLIFGKKGEVIKSLDNLSQLRQWVHLFTEFVRGKAHSFRGGMRANE